MSTVTSTREDILKEISELEMRIFELKQLVPPALKKFYRYRVSPGKYCWTYADSQEIAEAKIRQKMNRDYPPNEAGEPGWSFPVPRVDVFDEPAHAANNCNGNLCWAIGEQAALEFIKDYRADQKLKTESRNGSGEDGKMRNLVRSQVEADIEDFELKIRRREAS